MSSPYAKLVYVSKLHSFLRVSLLLAIALLLFLTTLAFAETSPLLDPAILKKKEELKEQSVETEHKIVLANGKELHYKATIGTVLLKDEQGNSKASLFYTSYQKQDVGDPKKRPITFCFNGGPGSSSIWLHMGIFGPKIVSMDSFGMPLFPYRSEDNPHTLLDATDLVFIDPVSTGYSRAAPGETDKQFHGVDEDIHSVADFIRIYTTRHDLWEAPKFLAGESYGTTRAAGLAEYLHQSEAMYLNGVVLISSILDFQTLAQNHNDLPYILYLPTYTAAAWYHKKIDPKYKSLEMALKEAENFAMHEYALALLKGDNLTKEEKSQTAVKLASLTGLSKEYIEQSNLRVKVLRFVKELLRKQNRSIGRFDCRFLGFEGDNCSETFESDPSFDVLFGAFTSTFHSYIRNDLRWMSEESYKVLADVSPWNYGKATNQYLNVGESLRYAMHRNPCLQVFVGSGFYDLATPYFATDYTFRHLGIDPLLKPNVTKKYYEGGHMMYTYKPSLIKLNQDLTLFIQNALTPKNLVE